MKKDIKKSVRNFMKRIDTKEMNTNLFVMEYYQYKDGAVLTRNIVKGPSIETILRCRRYLVKHEGFEREDSSRDSQEEYKKEFWVEHGIDYNVV